MLLSHGAPPLQTTNVRNWKRNSLNSAQLENVIKVFFLLNHKSILKANKGCSNDISTKTNLEFSHRHIGINPTGVPHVRVGGWTTQR